ncbi:MAG: hypothetical protein HQK77_11350 [Desulfobacterales bacterium]|nr:hypothetical protein [Desulfobacterales bacterium]
MNNRDYFKNYHPLRRVTAISIFGLGLIFSFVILLAKENNVLILNSDMAISKYSSVQHEFKTKSQVPVIEFDLGNRLKNENSIKELIINHNPDVIYCIGSKAYMLTLKLLKENHTLQEKKLIFSSAINWQRFTISNNTYGVSNELLPEMELTMFRYFFPKINKIGILFNNTYNQEWIMGTKATAKELGVEIVSQHINSPDNIENALKNLLPNVDAFWLIADPVVISSQESVVTIFNRCSVYKKPVFSYNDVYIKYGAMLIISVDIPTIGRQAASLAMDILANRDIKDQIQSPAGSTIALNLQKVKEYNLYLNKEALDSVNRIIK